jgi:hypothetical protein
MLEPLHAEHAHEMVAILQDPSMYTYTGGRAPDLEELMPPAKLRDRGVIRHRHRGDHFERHVLPTRPLDRARGPDPHA